jgi:hypothetical protein
VIIRGTRRILPAGVIWPRWGKIEIEVLPPIAAPVPGNGGQHQLKESARIAMQTSLGEALVERH